MIYFAADFHLGISETEQEYRQREKKIITWLDQIKTKAHSIVLLGDIFEFWYEWKNVIPKVSIRLLGKIAELSDLGIKIHFFVGNHDLWTKDFFEKELKIKVYRKPQILNFYGKNFYLAHGDGLIQTEKNYTLIKKYVFLNPFINFIFGRLLHPDRAFDLAMKFSDNKKNKYLSKQNFPSELQKAIENYILKTSETKKFDYVIFGHFHKHKILIINNIKTILLGDWLSDFSFAQFDGNDLELKNFKSE